MSNYVYTIQKKPGYTMFKLTPAPTGFSDVHFTISSDDSEVSTEGIIRDMWLRPHITFVPLGKSKFHAFLVTKNNKYTAVDSSRRAISNADYKEIIRKMLEDEEIKDAIFNPEKFVSGWPTKWEMS